MAMLRTIEEDEQDLIDQFGAHDMMARLRDRVVNPDRHAVSHKLLAGILREGGVNRRSIWRSPDNTELPDLVAGLSALWNPSAILSLQLLWLIIFLYTGRSTVTTAEISFSVPKDRI